MIMPFLFNIRDKVRPLNQLTDEQLMQRVAAKDDDRAFDELYHRHARRVMGFFYRQMNRDEERASDLMQDTLMRVWTARQRWNTDTEFLPWLFTIAFNICKNEYRHNGYKADYEQHVLHTQDTIYLTKVEERERIVWRDREAKKGGGNVVGSGNDAAAQSQPQCTSVACDGIDYAMFVSR